MQNEFDIKRLAYTFNVKCTRSLSQQSVLKIKSFFPSQFLFRKMQNYLLPFFLRKKKTESGNAFEQDWADIGAVGLNLAYSEDEPEYTLGMLKRANPTYAGR